MHHLLHSDPSRKPMLGHFQGVTNNVFEKTALSACLARPAICAIPPEAIALSASSALGGARLFQVCESMA
jgi:hypothetical protein